MLYDGIFFINHALRVKTLSVFTEEERFEQTLQTIKSIDERCKNNLKIIFDCSPEMPNIDYIKELNNHDTIVLYMGDEPSINHFSNIGSYGSRSIAETIAFIHFLNWFKKQNLKSKRIYKLSGRYCLNDNFVVNDPSYEDAFVFAKSHESWMRDNKGFDRLYLLRCWHMDYNLLDPFELQLSKILQDCSTYRVDVEHSYYKNLSTYKTIELDKIGVCGNIAPSGEYIDE
jgi:hypothetical protein